MNRYYRVIFNKSLGIFNVVGEIAKGATKASSGSTTSSGELKSPKRLTQAVPLFALLAISPVGAVQYWDTNGATSGSGNAGGVWDTTTSNWTTDPNGASAPTTWNNANGETYFSAGTDGTGALAIAIQPAGLSIGGENQNLIVKEGNLTFTGGNLAINTSELRVNAGASATFNNVLTGGGFSKTGGGTLSLTNSNNALSATNNRAIWQREGDLNIDGGTYRATGSQISHAFYIRPVAGVTTNTVLNDVILESFASADGVGGAGLFGELSTDGGVATNVTVNRGSISSSGLPAVAFSGSGDINLNNVTVSSSGSSANGVSGTSDSAIGMRIAMNGGTITTTNNDATSIGSARGAVGLASTGRTSRIDATDVVVKSNGYAAHARSDGAILNFLRGSLTSTAQDATAGSLAGAVVSLIGKVTLTDTAVTSTGTNIAGVVSRALNNIASQVTMTGTTVSTSGDGAAGLLANGNGASITLLDNNSISTTGAQAHGVRIDGKGAAVNFNGNGNASISTTGAGADAISVANGGHLSLEISSNVLPTVTGAGAAVLSADAGSIYLNTISLNTGMTAGSDTWGIAARNGGYVVLDESSTGGTGVLVMANSSVNAYFASDIAGSRIKLDGNGQIAVSEGVKIGSLESTSTNSLVYAGGNTLTIGANNATNNGSLVDNANYAGGFAFDNANINLTKTGSLNQILSGAGNTVGGVDIQQGRLTFAQSGDFTVAGNLNTASGATLGIGAVDATLKIGGVLTQAAGSRLDAILGASPDITANSAVLGGELTVSGFSLGAQPVLASQVTQNNYTMIRTVNGVTGNFTNVDGATGSILGNNRLDYLESYGFRSNDLKEYQLGFNLAWTTVNDDRRTGSFTLDANTAFDVDIALNDQAPSALTGWDGKTLTKNGEGLLQLSAANTYTGDTVLNGGVLKLDGAADISSSSALTVNGGQFDISSAAGNRTINNLSGSSDSKVALGGNTLIANNAQDATFAGVIEGAAGGFTKAGASTLTLTGDNTYTGVTTVDQGILQLGNGGTTGGVAGDIALNSGTTLVVNRANDLTLAGIFSGQGDLKQVGAGTLTLTGANSTAANVDIEQGRLTFAQPGDFTVTGNLNTASGATLGVGAVDATLKIGGVLTQAAGSRLDAILGASPDITADSAVLNGELTISGFSVGAQPVLASQVTQNNYTMIRTVNGVTGNFTNVDGADGSFVGNSGLDYLESYAFRSNDLKEYQLGFDLAWTTVNDDRRTGSFTLNANTGFDVDIALENQVPSALTGWDGKTLTKNGEGLLQLSAMNTYTGDTLLNGGVLKLDGAGDIASSNALTISGGQFDISSAAGNRTVNNLSGTGGEIMLAGKALTVNNAQDGTFAGDFDASAGGLIKVGAGELVLSGNTAFTGDTLLNAGQLTLDGSNGKAKLVSNIIGQTGTRLDLINGAVLTGTIDPTDVTIDQASVWNMTGTSDVATMTLAGNINFADPGATLQSGRTLTATNWVGQGGTVNMYAALGGNDSVADKLIIDGGQATGTTNLNIRNAGGLGDQTTGNGINVVQTQNSATTAVDAFALANAEGKVLAGAYEYRLARAGEDWFLQSELNQVDPVDPVRPVRPVYSPATSLHTAKAEQALQYAESTVGTLHERMGDLEALNAKTDNLAWGRVIGKHVRNDGASDGIYGKDIDSRGDISALQIGNDFYVNAEGKGRTSAGAFLTLGHGKYDVTHAYDANDRIAAGDNSFDAYSLGGYFTQLNGDGGYLDTVLQVTSFDQTVSPRGLKSKSSNALGVLASIEGGQRFDVGAPEQGLQVEPQAQVIVQTLKQDDSKVVSNVGTESDVSYDRSTTLTSRVGARLSKTWLTADEGAASVWITPSVINTIGDDSQTRFATPSQGDVKLNNKLSGTRASLQFGIDGHVAKGVSVSAMLGGESSLDGDNSTAYGGQLGVKIDF